MGLVRTLASVQDLDAVLLGEVGGGVHGAGAGGLEDGVALALGDDAELVAL